MATITAITSQVRTENRVNVHLDGKYWVSLDIQQVIDLGLKVGKILDDTAKATIEKESSYGKAYAAALNYISIRIRSEKEIRDYGFKKRWEEEMTERVIERLRTRGYLDDSRFAARWAENRQLSKPMSKRRLVQELRQKGIDSDDLTEALTGFDEAATLAQVIEKKASKYQDNPDKLKAYLMRQGFSYEAINNAINMVDTKDFS